MPYNNNSFTEDTDAQHSERAHTLANGIGDHGTDLLYTPAEITEMQGYADEFDAAYSVQVEENADVDAKNVELSAKFEELKSQYVSCQDYIRGEMVLASGHDKEYLNERFDIYGELPRTRQGVQIMVRAMLTGYDSIGVELPSVTLPAVLFEALRTLSGEYTNIAEDEIRDEEAEKKAATVLKNEVRRRGEKMFSRLRHRAISLWGDDDPRMLEIGLVPKSMIWTEGSGEPEPGVEGVPWPGPMAGFEVNLIALPLTTEIIFTRIFDCPKCVLERELEGTGAWAFITEYDLEEEEILPFRDNVPHPGKWHYRATPFNAVGEVGVVSEGTIEVV